MAKRKVVLDEKGDSVLMGVMAENSDPVIKTYPGGLEDNLVHIPDLLEEAEAKWATSLKNPAYKAPPEPKKETKTAASKPAAGKTAEELPLLSGTEQAPVKAEVTTEVKAEVPTEVKAEAQVEAVVTPGPEQPAAVVVAGEEKTAMSKMREQAPAATPATPAGQWQYQLKDGRGPYNTVQEAMDAMGLDKATRPQHNRWDRLSTQLKDAIRKVEKKV